MWEWIFEVLGVIKSGEFDKDGVGRSFCSLFNFELFLIILDSFKLFLLLLFIEFGFISFSSVSILL